jgi:hypothetical protein
MENPYLIEAIVRRTTLLTLTLVNAFLQGSRHAI